MSEAKKPLNFIEQIIEKDIAEGKNDGRVHTRFPPEPNGYLHIGHAKALCTNFMIAQKYGGKTNLRFDDTNPVKEDASYVAAIKEDIKWLGFDWEDRLFFSSDYFQQLYDYAIILINRSLAYVDDSSQEVMSKMRGTPKEPGEESSYRNRSADENLNLFERMKNGEFEEGSKVLRAKIDMKSPNMHMRDPVMYRILKAHHHRTGNAWCIYPMYDYAHSISDSIEKVTHSLCSLEFDDHRPLYNWFLEKLEIFPSKQYEFARLNLDYTVMSKRKLKELVENDTVNGWDDPRMPTLSALRRRGFTPEAIINFNERVGLAKRNNVIEYSLLEFCVREDLNKKVARVMGVLNPLKVTITNYPNNKIEELELINNPENEAAGSRKIPFSNEIWIEKEDFMEDAPRKFFRLKPGGVVRLKGAYIIQCDEVMKNEAGEVVELKCSYFENSKSGQDTSGVKSKGVIHWVSIAQGIEAEVRIYDRLFTDPTPDAHKDGTIFNDYINANSLKVIKAIVEPSLANAKQLDQFQFMRKGYFNVDYDSKPNALVFNQTVTLKDSWKKKQ